MVFQVRPYSKCEELQAQRIRSKIQDKLTPEDRLYGTVYAIPELDRKCMRIIFSNEEHLARLARVARECDVQFNADYFQSLPSTFARRAEQIVHVLFEHIAHETINCACQGQHSWFLLGDGTGHRPTYEQVRSLVHVVTLWVAREEPYDTMTGLLKPSWQDKLDDFVQYRHIKQLDWAVFFQSDESSFRPPSYPVTPERTPRRI